MDYTYIIELRDDKISYTIYNIINILSFCDYNLHIKNGQNQNLKTISVWHIYKFFIYSNNDSMWKIDMIRIRIFINFVYLRVKDYTKIFISILIELGNLFTT